MLFKLTATIKDEVDRVRRAAKDAARRSFSRTAFLIWQTAGASIKQAKGPSDPGEPPHTHRGAWMWRALKYKADRDGAVIGPTHSVMADAGAAHEFGGEFRGTQYPARPFMRPALEKNADIFASDWKGSITS